MQTNLSTGKPKMPSFWAIRNKIKLVNQELKEKFLLKVAITADIKVWMCKWV
jgi:hypothetical protein